MIWRILGVVVMVVTFASPRLGSDLGNASEPRYPTVPQPESHSASVDPCI